MLIGQIDMFQYVSIYVLICVLVYIYYTYINRSGTPATEPSEVDR